MSIESEWILIGSAPFPDASPVAPHFDSIIERAFNNATYSASLFVRSPISSQRIWKAELGFSLYATTIFARRGRVSAHFPCSAHRHRRLASYNHTSLESPSEHTHDYRGYVGLYEPCYQ